MISIVLHSHLKDELASKYIKTSRYNSLAAEIPDNILRIDEVYPEEELDSINERFEPYLGAYKVFPFLGILGGNVVAIGYGTSNKGKIYYYDFDFGIFELDTTIKEFLDGLETQE